MDICSLNSSHTRYRFPHSCTPTDCWVLTPPYYLNIRWCDKCLFTTNSRDWFIDTLDWTTALLTHYQGLCNLVGVLKAHALTKHDACANCRAKEQWIGLYCYDVCAYCRAWRHMSWVLSAMVDHICLMLMVITWLLLAILRRIPSFGLNVLNPILIIPFCGSRTGRGEVV